MRAVTRSLFVLFLLVFSYDFSFARVADSDPLPGNGHAPIEWRAPLSDVIRLDDSIGVPIHRNDRRHFDSRPGRHAPLLKKRVDQLFAKTCETIRENRDRLPQEKISRSTQYFTPMFEPGEDGKLQEKDRRACINMEGSCIVGAYLYNWTSLDEPWGTHYLRSEIKFKFGKGSGESEYNVTNALDPCRTVAADPNVYPAGTVIYVPSMRDKVCPQNGKEIDGCFVVGDVGGAIKGKGRFDIYTGECAQYNRSNSTCDDEGMSGFWAVKGSPFYLVARDNVWARALREEADRLVDNDWVTPQD